MATTRTLDQFKSNMANTWYSDSQLEWAYDLLKSGTSVNDVVNLLNKWKTTTPATKTTTTTPTNISSSWASSQNKTSSNSWVGNYSTWSSNNAYNSANWTTSTTTQPKTYTTSTWTEASKSDIAKSVADTWNSKSYQEQQDLLKKNPQLQTYLQQNGLTLKRETEWANQYNVADRPEAIQPNKPEQWWDYQSNEEWRTQEVIQNLDWYKRNNPSLFSSWENYKSFFIDGKGRSPEQEQLVAQYYRDYQKYKPYDNMSGSDIWVWLANWTIPSDYLDYLKNNDPVKYGEALEAMKGEQTKIWNQASYESMLQSEWIWSSWAWTTANKDWDIKDYYAWSGIFKDENSDWVDDRLYVAPSEEEKQNVDRINQLLAQKQRIQDEIDANYEELVKQYPWASSSTLRAMANDQSANLNKELKELTYQLTQLQGNVEYMQNERNTQMEAWYKSIWVLQKDLWMYYDYSAQWISELAQNKYAATNVSFEQADNWTYTQKQMALESVLSPIYEQYGSIIQRPQAQVINDIINYAQEKGIGLEQAFNENFMNQLKSKPAYQNIQNQLASTEPKLQKLWEDSNWRAIMWYWNPDTKSFTQVNVWGWTSDLWGVIWWTSTNIVSNFESLLESRWYVMWDKNKAIRSWWCGTVVNEYLKELWESINLKEANDIAKYATEKNATEWSIVYFNWSQSWATEETKKRGHVAIVKSDNWDTITVLESNVWTWLREATYKKSDVTWYYTPAALKQNSVTVSKVEWVSNARAEWIVAQNNKYARSSSWNSNWYNEDLISEYKKYLENPSYEWHTDLEYKLQWYWMSFADFAAQAQNYWATTWKENWLAQASTALSSATKLYQMLYIWVDSAQSWLIDFIAQWLPKSSVADARSEYDTLMKQLQLNALTEAKAAWATFWAMSDSEWEILWQSATDLNWNWNSWREFKQRLETLIYWLQDSIVQWWWQLPSNYANSLASQYVYQNQKSLDVKYHTNQSTTSWWLWSSRL